MDANIRSLPRSSKVILTILDKEGAMTHKDIVNKSRLAPRTVRYALKRLREHDLLIEKLNVQDMRRIIYHSKAPIIMQGNDKEIHQTRSEIAH
jgi:predicted transcriptional regulator